MARRGLSVENVRELLISLAVVDLVGAVRGKVGEFWRLPAAGRAVVVEPDEVLVERIDLNEIVAGLDGQRLENTDADIVVV